MAAFKMDRLMLIFLFVPLFNVGFTDAQDAPCLAECMPDTFCVEVFQTETQCNASESQVCCVRSDIFGCLSTRGCENENGICLPNCADPRIEIPGLCGSSGECKCCAPKCPYDESCEYSGGKCRDVCGKNEEEKPGLCDPDFCRCCVPNYCEQNSTCAVEGGHCIPWDRTCDGYSRSDWCGDSCQCCFPPEACPNTPACESCQGRCSSSCEGENVGALQGLCSSDYCSCCYSCSPGDICKEMGGSCIPYNQYCKGRTTSEFCPGGYCTCCIPDRCVHEYSNLCANFYGACRERCDPHESERPFSCMSPYCKCCYSCYTDGCCANAGGRCVSRLDQCPTGNVAEGLCSTPGCFCCLLEHNCESEANYLCSMHGGTCKSSCESWEAEVPGGCDSPNCKCCYSCVTYDNGCCDRAGGKCVPSANQCPSGILSAGMCDGNGCFCCLPEHHCEGQPTELCNYYTGTCNDTCSVDEAELPAYGCTSPHCKCCYLCDVPGDCAQHGGYCVPRADMCGTDVATEGLCEKYGCFCCIPVCSDAATTACFDASGECKAACGSGEYEVIDGCSSPCKCCYSCPTSDVCASQNGLCVGFDNCVSGVVAAGLCDGDSCVCCINIVIDPDTIPLATA